MQKEESLKARSKPKDTSVWVESIEGRFRRISVSQFAHSWWLYNENEITARQLRIYFALHEMAERRRETPGHRQQNFCLLELRKLIGARDDSKVTDRKLQQDLVGLEKSGLAKVVEQKVVFLKPDLSACQPVGSSTSLRHFRIKEGRCQFQGEPCELWRADLLGR